MNKHAADMEKSCIFIHNYYVNVQIKRKNQKFTRFREKRQNGAKEYESVTAAKISHKRQDRCFFNIPL